MNKETARKIAKERVSSMSQSERDIHSFEACERLLEQEFYQLSKRVLVYNSIKNELDTSLIFHLNKDKELFLPRIKGNEMEIIEITSDTQFEKGPFGILEPVGAPTTKEIDLVVLPLVAVDRDGNRCGKGKGYYDRYLKDKNVVKVAISFPCQIIEDGIDCESHDIKVDYIVSSSGVSKIENNIW